jgi:exopolyphosphatase
VIGNETADADSIVTSIVVAFLRHLADQTGGPYLPVIRCSLEDMVMRGAAQLLLHDAGIDAGRLLYLPPDADAELLAAIIAGPTILTDHNDPNEPAGMNVIEIIDHHNYAGHFDEGGKHHNGGLLNKRIQSTISCSTLVAEELQESPHLLTDPDLHTIRKMLLGVILLDSHGLHPKKAVTSLDADIAHTLAGETGTEILPYHEMLEKAHLNEKFWASATPSQVRCVGHPNDLRPDQLTEPHRA